MRAFHENPNRIDTELTFINGKPLKPIITKCMGFLLSTKIFEASLTNSVDPDQTAPVGAVRSGSTMFASMLMLNRHFQMQLFGWRFKDKIMCFASILR